MSASRGIPAQWEQQSGLLISWPHTLENLDAVEASLRQLISAVAANQPVIIACHDAELIGRLAIELGDILGDLRFFHAPNDNMWVRDCGPISCRLEGQLSFYDFQFNGWGSGENCDQNNRLTAQLDQQCIFQANVVYQNLVLEAGSLESDGCGTLLCHSQMLKLRNPDYSRSEIESYLCKHLDAQRVLWLEHGHLVGDQSGHAISHLLRFVNADTLAYSASDDPQDEHYLALQALRGELESLTNTQGQTYQLLPLPLPQPIRNALGDVLPASYCDFLISNQHVFVPQFDDANDALALVALQQHFPEREVLGINSLALLEHKGSLHMASLNLFAEITY